MAIAAVASLLALCGVIALPRSPTESTVARLQDAPPIQNERPKAPVGRGAVPINAPAAQQRPPAGNAVANDQAKPRPQLAAPSAARNNPRNQAELQKEAMVFRGTGQENATPEFVVDDDWELRWEFRNAPVTLYVTRFNEYVTLDQIATIVSKKVRGFEMDDQLDLVFPGTQAEIDRIERTVRKWKDVPAPDLRGVGGNPDEWKWARIRPWLEAKTRRAFPQAKNHRPFRQESPTNELWVSVTPGAIGHKNFGHGGKYIVSFVPSPGNEGPWKFEVVQLPNRIE